MDRRLLKYVIAPFVLTIAAASLVVYLVWVPYRGSIVGVAGAIAMIGGFLRSGLLKKGQPKRVVCLTFVAIYLVYLLGTLFLLLHVPR